MKSSAYASFLGSILISSSVVSCGGDDDAPASTEATSTGGSSGSGGSSSGGSTTNGGGTGGSSSVTNGAAGGTGGSAGAGGAGLESQNIVEIASSDDRFETLVQALVDAELDDDLAGDGPFTVFAPTDDAFELLPDGLLESLDEETLSDVLLYHVVEGRVAAADVVDLDSATTLLGDDLKIMVDDDTVVLNGLVQVTVTDIEASNGIIHVIDSVLLPGTFPGDVVEAVSAYPRLGTLAGAVTDNVAQALMGDEVTLFAPVNSAFEGVDLPEDESALEDLLLYHAVPADVPAATAVTLASAQMANGAYLGIKASEDVQLFDGQKDVDVTYTDIRAQNGVIHLIDGVLTPPGTIAEVATLAGLSELVDALSITDVPGTTTSFAEAAAGDGPLTVFAPSNAAFMAIDGSFGDGLADVLGAHVIPSIVDSKAVVAAIEGDGMSPTTLTGAADDTLALSLGESGVLVNGMVQVVATDIPARNGLIHLVDSVIVPSDVVFPGTLVDAVTAYPIFGSLVDAVSHADPGVANALGGAGPLTLFAPVNAAFDGIDTSEDLTNVLLYHALPVEADSSFVLANFSPAAATTTAEGSDVTIDADALTVNDANITRVDLRTENGVIHVIDAVLLPPAD